MLQYFLNRNKVSHKLKLVIKQGAHLIYIQRNHISTHNYLSKKNPSNFIFSLWSWQHKLHFHNIFWHMFEHPLFRITVQTFVSPQQSKECLVIRIWDGNITIGFQFISETVKICFCWQELRKLRKLTWKTLLGKSYFSTIAKRNSCFIGEFSLNKLN